MEGEINKYNFMKKMTLWMAVIMILQFMTLKAAIYNPPGFNGNNPVVTVTTNGAWVGTNPSISQFLSANGVAFSGGTGNMNLAAYTNLTLPSNLTILLRQGSLAQIGATTLSSGEPAWATDTAQLFIGTGTNAGGTRVKGDFTLLGANNFAVYTSSNVTASGVVGSNANTFVMFYGVGGVLTNSNYIGGGGGGSICLTNVPIYIAAGAGGTALNTTNTNPCIVYGGSGGDFEATIINMVCGKGGAASITNNTKVGASQTNGLAKGGGFTVGTKINADGTTNTRNALFLLAAGNGGDSLYTLGRAGGAVSTVIQITGGNGGGGCPTTNGIASGAQGGTASPAVGFLATITGGNGGAAGNDGNGGNAGTMSGIITATVGSGGNGSTNDGTANFLSQGGSGGSLGSFLNLKGGNGGNGYGALAGGNGGAVSANTFNGGNGGTSDGTNNGGNGGASGSINLSGGDASGTNGGGAGGVLNLLGATANSTNAGPAAGKIILNGDATNAVAGPQILCGYASPQSNTVAPVGSLYLRTAGGATNTLWVKESGTGNTGWVAK